MLTIIPTPIGNLEDITLRALRVLRESDIIACEDTRKSLILLKHYNINNAVLVPFHLHNENKILPKLINDLKNNKNIAVISDAGTPGISDPGWILLKRAIDENLDVDVLPGPAALLPAILLSGITPPHPFLFYGFPPEKLSERRNLFNNIKNLPYTLCFYISPHKAVKDISDILEIFGDRNAALVREISKIYQEAIRGVLSEILKKVKAGLKGEMVLVIKGCKNDIINDDEWRDRAREMKLAGETVKNIVKKINLNYRVAPNKIKEYLNENK